MPGKVHTFPLCAWLNTFDPGPVVLLFNKYSISDTDWVSFPLPVTHATVSFTQKLSDLASFEIKLFAQLLPGLQSTGLILS